MLELRELDRGLRPMTRRCTVLAVLCISMVVVSCSGGDSSAQLGTLGDAPSWEMVTHSGSRLSSEDLRGKVYLANFIWTNCRDTCPTLSLQMGLLQERLKQQGLLGEQMVLLSFSFDSERDTPERLNRYAEIFNAEPEAWLFLTGTPDQVYDVVTLGFGVSYRAFTPTDTDKSNLADEVIPDEGTGEAGASLAAVTGAGDIGQLLDIDYSIDFEHQNVFVLVDGEGEIRQYYIDLFLDVDRMMSDVESLLNE